ncbi:MAG: hydrolase [Chitinophagaceae bacterium]|nr:hydrolase [Chitinophagaceae bacterium]
MSENKNPWQILSQRNIYDNSWINVTEYDVINPSGGKGIYGKVHFKNYAIGVIPLDEDWNTWLVGQYRFTIDGYSWEMPEGGGMVNAAPVESAKRELKEETGLNANEWTEILRLHLSNSISDEYSIIFLARGLEEGIAMPEETEKLVVKKLPFDEVYDMVKTGKITDAMTIAAVQKIKLMMMEGLIKK